jgi:hypothetical protein
VAPLALAAAAAGAAECAAEAAWESGVGAAKATHTAQTIRTATAHITRVKRRFIRPQSAKRSGFIVRFGFQVPRPAA